jgi:hypothetical protein
VVSSCNTLALSLREFVSSSNEWTESEEEKEKLEIKEDFLISSFVAFKKRRDSLKKFFHCSKISIKDCTLNHRKDFRREKNGTNEAVVCV